VKVTVGILSKENKNVVGSVLDILKSIDMGQPLHFGLMTPKQGNFNKTLALLSKQSQETSVATGFATTQSMTTSGYDFLQLEDSSVLFEGRLYASALKRASIMRANRGSKHCEATLQTLLGESEGDYAVWMLKDNEMGAIRDPMGMQPLYFGENSDIVAYATNQTTLWKLGIKESKSFPPGTLGFVNKKGFRFRQVKILSYTKPKQITLEEAAQTLQALLTEAVRCRVQDLKEVAVAFSGGLDCSIIAYLAAMQGIKVSLLHVSLENQPETEEALKAAKALDLPMYIQLFKESDVEAALPRVVELIEEPDPIKAAIGVPFYWLALQATQAKFQTILAGQGADEMFAGYQRYVNQVCKDKVEAVYRTIYHDVCTLHESNLERDRKIMGYYDIELRCPFVSHPIAQFALGLPLECKIEPNSDTLRKLVLRKTAKTLGMPESIVNKPKKAIQYSTGINNAVKQIAKENAKSMGEYIKELFEHQRASIIPK
jgi:asparagine synthase (glutamine-hydrolysing)